MFPNRAGDHEDTDDVLAAELEAAGIDVIKMEFFRHRRGEVKTAVMGEFYGWGFERAWTYWVCEGPGIEVEEAERLHAAHGKTVRVSGHCGCPSPREYLRGLACGRYHVDDQKGLNALADTIRKLANKPKPKDLAEAIADDLFTNGNNDKAQRLVLEMEDQKDGGGLCRQAVIDRIKKFLTQTTS